MTDKKKTTKKAAKKTAKKSTTRGAAKSKRAARPQSPTSAAASTTSTTSPESVRTTISGDEVRKALAYLGASTIGAIAKQLNVSTSTAKQHLARLGDEVRAEGTTRARRYSLVRATAA